MCQSISSSEQAVLVYIYIFPQLLSIPGPHHVHPAHSLHACIHILTRLEQFDSLGALVRLLGVLLVDVVVDLRLRREGLEPLYDPSDELCHVGGRGGLGVGQGHVYHEDIGQDTGEREGDTGDEGG